jgi:hypothetical protein
LDSFQWNIGQVVGPVLGGAVLRGAGTTVFFALCGTVMLPLIGFLLLWRGRDDLRLSTPGGSAAESLLGAISSGWRYFSNTPGLPQVTPEWVQTRSLSLFYVVFQGPFVLGGLGFGVIDTFLPLRDTLLVAAIAFVPGILLIPRYRLPVVDRSSLQLVASPALAIGEHVHPDDGPVLILIEYRVDGEDVDDFLASMAELRIVRRRLGGTRWGVYQDVTAHGKFFETFLVPSWNGYLLQRDHYTKADREVEARAFAFHRGPDPPRITRLVHPDTVEAARARSAWRREMLRLLRPQ